MTAQEWFIWFGLCLIITPLVSGVTVWAIQKWTTIRAMRKVHKQISELSELLARRVEKEKEVKP